MLYFFSNFALVIEKILRVHNVNDYARYIGAPVLHPLVSVIHYDELEHCPHDLPMIPLTIHTSRRNTYHSPPSQGGGGGGSGWVLMVRGEAYLYLLGYNCISDTHKPSLSGIFFIIIIKIIPERMQLT
jgi:hypothetical protein